MSEKTVKTDWDPETYNRFRGFRLRPAMDLLHAVPALPNGGIVDLGCGSGSVGPALAALGRVLTGVDSSPAMLVNAQETKAYDTVIQADIAQWLPDKPQAMIFSNAALHWVDDHTTVLAHLVDALLPGGTLAVQMPHQNNAPSHRLWHTIVADLFPGKFNPDDGPGILFPADYYRCLEPRGAVSLWETEYYQRLAPVKGGHPVRRFTEATFARPVLEALDPDQQSALKAAYDTVIDKAYPFAEDGSVLFPFRRLFFTVTRAQ